MLFWKARFAEWAFPALTAGATHLAVDASTLADAVRMLEENTTAAKALREKAADVNNRIMCPACLAAYVSEVIDEVRAHFALSKLLDDPCATHAFFDALNCQRRDLVVIRATRRRHSSFDVSEFMHRRLTTNATFEKTTCHEIASRAHECRAGTDRLGARARGWHAALLYRWTSRRGRGGSGGNLICWPHTETEGG